MILIGLALVDFLYRFHDHLKAVGKSLFAKAFRGVEAGVVEAVVLVTVMGKKKSEG